MKYFSYEVKPLILKKMRISVLAVLLGICATPTIYADTKDVQSVQQTKQISGQVLDSQNEPLIGVSIQVKGTTIGTVTDIDGNYAIQAPAGGVLVFSYVGYTTQEIPVGNQATIRVVLTDDSKVLDEVVVVGYGSTVKKDLTTAVTTVRSQDFLQGATNNPMQLINGKVAGVNLSGESAADPNADPNKIQVRGASSVKAGNKPLIVIDGMPGGDLRSISQQDIESITVLKDGSAAAIYGSRAANGVILIQTKQGQAGKVSISYDGYVEHDFVADRPGILSADDFVEHGIDVDHGYRTNWYDEILNKDNFGQNHNVALSGGSESSIFRISANYKTKEGLDISTNRKETGVRASFKQKTLENMLELTGNISYRVADEDYTEGGSFKQALELNPTWNVDEMEAFKNSFDTYNPVKNLTERDRGARQEYSNIDFNIKLNILKNLSTEVNLARRGQNTKSRDYRTSKHRETYREGIRGWAELEDKFCVDYLFEWLGNYSFKVDKHDFKIMGGYSYQEYIEERMKAQNRNFPSDAYTWNNLDAGDYEKESGRLGMESEKKAYKTIAFLARLNYDFDNLILFTGSIRYEGSSKFGPDHRWGTFPAASAAWRFSRLSFLQDADAVDDLKLRFSYGETGRSDFDDYYLYMAKYSGYGNYLTSSGQWVKGYGPGNNSNYGLKWEKQISYNLGVDYTLFDSRLSGSVEFFIRDGKDVINEYTVPMPPYLHDKIWTNVGTTTSKGVELQTSWDAVRTKDFTYSTDFTVAYTKSKLKSFSNDQYKLGYINNDGLPSPGNPGYAQRLEDGKEIGSYYCFRYAGVDDDGNIMVYKGGVKGNETIRGDEASDDDKTYIGNGSPKWMLSWGNTFTYKGFDLSFFLRGKFDYEILNMHQMYYGLQGVAGINKLESAYKENAHIKGTKLVCDYFLESGDYLKMENITLGWTPKLNTKWISNLRVYGSIRNVFTITSYSVMDPANVQNQDGIWVGQSGLDLYPTARNITFGVQITY
jgi:TonB-linked SusC/RagA family outer membrane protein